MDKKEKTLKAVADIYELPVDLVRQSMDNLHARYLRSMRELTKPPRYVKISASEAVLPPLPKGLKWPEEHFVSSPEFRKHGGICRHLERVWKPLIQSGVIDMPTLRDFYPSTAEAIDGYKHRGVLRNGTPDSLPADIDIPLVKPGSGRRRMDNVLKT